MKILREDIPNEGLAVTFSDLLAKPADLAESNVVLNISRPPQACLRLMPMAENMVRVEGRFNANLQVCCSRCLNPLQLELEGCMQVVFQPQPAGGEDEVMLSARDLEVYFYDGVELDLTELLRSELALLVPYAPQCGSQCVALCGKCGASPCQCGQTKIDPRWNKLAGLKFD